MTTVGSLCSGYGGLDMGLALGLGTTLRHAWHVEYDKHPAAILAHRYPGVPNYGDVKTTNWAEVEPVDWLTAGYPCQPFSHAGLRKGADDPRHLWPGVANALGVLRPRGVLLENVRGHVSLGLADVLADLSGLGYDATWGVVRASDAGAPHGRARIFIVATDARGQRRDGRPHLVGEGRDQAERGEAGGDPRDGRSAAAPAPDAGGERHGRGEDAGGLGCLDGPDAGEARQRQRSRGESQHRGAATAADAGSGPLAGPAAAGDGLRLATERCDEPASDADSDGRVGLEELHARPPAGVDGEHRRHPDGRGDVPDWGPYTGAVRRWEDILERPAPRPTEPAHRGSGERLSAVFVEWMMGLPEGWVTDVPGIPRNAQLKALGNGVVPQQAALAVRLLTTQRGRVAA